MPESSDGRSSDARSAAFWKGVVVGLAAVAALVLIAWAVMGSCPMCGRMQ